MYACRWCVSAVSFFFFQAEDGIRDLTVTGVQTCALPISCRRDLFHRIYVFPLVLPPLRERPEDFAPLVGHFAGQVAAQNGWKEKTFSEEAIAELQKYSWPGNVRELRNVVERLVLLAESA